jgi:hypothetical protein
MRVGVLLGKGVSVGGGIVAVGGGWGVDVGLGVIVDSGSLVSVTISWVGMEVGGIVADAPKQPVVDSNNTMAINRVISNG